MFSVGRSTCLLLPLHLSYFLEHQNGTLLPPNTRTTTCTARRRTYLYERMRKVPRSVGISHSATNSALPATSSSSPPLSSTNGGVISADAPAAASVLLLLLAPLPGGMLPLPCWDAYGHADAVRPSRDEQRSTCGPVSTHLVVVVAAARRRLPVRQGAAEAGDGKGSLYSTRERRRRDGVRSSCCYCYCCFCSSCCS